MFEELMEKLELATERNTEQFDSKEMVEIKDKMTEVDFKRTREYFENSDDLGW